MQWPQLFSVNSKTLVISRNPNLAAEAQIVLLFLLLLLLLLLLLNLLNLLKAATGAIGSIFTELLSYNINNTTAYKNKYVNPKLVHVQLTNNVSY